MTIYQFFFRFENVALQYEQFELVLVQSRKKNKIPQAFIYNFDVVLWVLSIMTVKLKRKNAVYINIKGQ